MIENGVEFKFGNGKFSTKSFDISLPNKKLGNKRTLLVFESKDEITHHLSSRPPSEKSAMLLKVRNGVLVLTTLGDLVDHL